jgi:hypothetical protein
MRDVVEGSCLEQGNNSALPARSWLASNDAHPIRHQFASNLMPEDREVTWTQHKRILNTKFGWQACKGLYAEFRERHLARPDERACKDGSAFIPGNIIGSERQAKAVAQLDIMFFDLDREDEQAAKECLARITAAGLAYDAHTTYAHESEETEVSSEAYLAWAREHNLDEASVEAAMQFRARRNTPQASLLGRWWLNRCAKPVRA